MASIINLVNRCFKYLISNWWYIVLNTFCYHFTHFYVIFNSHSTLWSHLTPSLCLCPLILIANFLLLSTFKFELFKFLSRKQETTWIENLKKKNFLVSVQIKWLLLFNSIVSEPYLTSLDPRLSKSTNTVQSTYINILYIDISLYRHVFKSSNFSFIIFINVGSGQINLINMYGLNASALHELHNPLPCGFTSWLLRKGLGSKPLK